MKKKLTETLREETREQHNRTEKTEIFEHLLNGKIDIHQYKTMLEYWSHIFGINLPEISQHIETDKKPLDWLKHDLEKLHHVRTNYDGAAYNIDDFSLKTDTIAKAVGCSYVLRGAQLGNQLIYSRLTKNTASSLWPMRFLLGDAKQTRTNWVDFCEKINSVPLTKEQLDEAIQYAILTFDTVRKTFSSIKK